jgi:DNA-binding response OmpR family regulator
MEPAGLRSQQSEDREDASAAITATCRNRPKVLCIDDDPKISESLKIRLECYGIEVFRAFDGMPGYWTALDTKPDVIITDLGMPDGDGNYVFGRLQMNPLTKNIPVIVLTGETNPAVKRHLLASGVAACFCKPMVFDELLQELRRHIDLPKKPVRKPVRL